jgi:NhaP-type Na+/H+ and K+/H+ antiporter
VARGLLLLLCWVPFNYTGYPLTWRTALVFMWAGLRGAVGIIMALFVFVDEKIHDESFRCALLVARLGLFCGGRGACSHASFSLSTHMCLCRLRR